MENEGRFTLRELYWRAQARQNEQWDYMAWLCLHVVAPHSRERLRPQMFHPRWMAANRQNPLQLAADLAAARATLPAQLSEAEKELRWEQIFKKADRDERK